MDSVDFLPGFTKVALITNSKFYPHFSEWADSRDRVGKATIVILDDGTTDDLNKRGAINDIIYTIDQLGIVEDICTHSIEKTVRDYEG